MIGGMRKRYTVVYKRLAGGNYEMVDSYTDEGRLGDVIRRAEARRPPSAEGYEIADEGGIVYQKEGRWT
jgi:hypothetical protein